MAPRVLPPPVPRTDGAIYQAGQEMALFADLKARRVGDVLTIVLNEATTASKSAEHHDFEDLGRDRYRTHHLRQVHPTKGVPILDTTLSGSHTFDGEGSSDTGQQLGREPDGDRDRGREQRQPGGRRRQEL